MDSFLTPKSGLGGRPLTLAEACEARHGRVGLGSAKAPLVPCKAAGRGVTTGKTAQDDEVQVLDPDEAQHGSPGC